MDKTGSDPIGNDRPSREIMGYYAFWESDSWHTYLIHPPRMAFLGIV